MPTTLLHRSGEMTIYEDDGDLDALLAELDEYEDREHPDVAVTDESGWTVSCFVNGNVVWESVEGDSSPRHRPSLSRAQQRELLIALVRGNVSSIEQESWLLGYGT